MEITINYYGQAVSVSVEVYEYLTQADHKAENLAHEQRQIGMGANLMSI